MSTQAATAVAANFALFSARQPAFDRTRTEPIRGDRLSDRIGLALILLVLAIATAPLMGMTRE